MDPGEVQEELQRRTDIEEMLIAQVFTVIAIESHSRAVTQQELLNSDKKLL